MSNQFTVAEVETLQLIANHLRIEGRESCANALMDLAEKLVQFIPLDPAPNDSVVNSAREEFIQYFERNYPPGTLIGQPAWHAPRLFTAAFRALIINPAKKGN